jgi:hypothetical protein
VLAFGHGIPLPQAAAVSRVLRSGSSVVVSLAEMPDVEQPAYVDELLAHLEAARAADGLPQWIIIDEAHYFFGEQSSSARRLSAVTGNFVLVTYRPSLISLDAIANVGAHLVTSTTVDDERYVIASLLAARGPREHPTDEALGALIGRQTGLLVTDPAPPQWRVFTPSVRRIDHTHHARKYADRHLPRDKAFHFHTGDGLPALVASNLAEFYAAVGTLSLASIRLHLAAHDFSRWAQGVLGDETLARGLRKIERTVAGGASPNRGEIQALIERLYDI